jgi:hypothetical protein
MSVSLAKSPVHISIMSGKLATLKSISTNTLTNKFCLKTHLAKMQSICTFCYSHSMLAGFRKNAAPALQRNSDLLSSRILKDDEIPTITDKVFRYSAHGELINAIHMHNLVLIVEANPNTTFSLWTKRKDIVNKYFDRAIKPSNMIIIYSNPKISNVMHTVPKGFDKTFNNVLEHELVDEQNCTGQQCKDCLLCYNHMTTNVIVEKVKSYGKTKAPS